MDADPINRIDPASRKGEMAPDDLPHALRVRYLKDHRGGPGLGYYEDATSPTAVFRDMGDRLYTSRNDPNVVRDLVAIAAHRGWTEIDVRGQTAFRREAWIAARQAGLAVRGYRPTERDEQDLGRRSASKPQPRQPHSRPDTMKIVETVVRNRVVEPAEQSRILAAAGDRLSRWLEQGANPDRGQGRHGPTR